MSHRSLPIIDPSDSRELGVARVAKVSEQRSLKAAVVHAIRIILIALFLTGLHRYAASANRLSLNETSRWERIKIAEFVPNATSLEPLAGEEFIRRAVATDGTALALVATSSPNADHIIGYSGPTSLLLIMDEERTVQSVKVVHSFDTPEHLQQVVNDLRFWQQFTGKKWGEGNALKIDGVSGATLTSLAIAESVVTCLSSSHQQQEQAAPGLSLSLKFPDELTEDEKQTWVLRTGPLSDDISGYQGPTELLLKIDSNDQLIDLKIRSSFDNEPYVGYTRQERSFWKKFKGRSLADLAALDLDAEQIDGVSGATMTSIAVANTIREASKEYLAQQAALRSLATDMPSQASRSPRWNFSSGELLTIILTLTAVFWSGSKLRGRRPLRPIWQITCFTLIALISGNLLSISLISGWTRGGISYRLAPGLTLLLAVSFVMAIFWKRNVYCDHLCPHGILQQWIRPTSTKRRGSFAESFTRILNSKGLVRLLSTLGWAAVAIGFVSLVRPTGINLSWLEPFDAYLLGFGFSVSAIIWGLSLIAARLSPLYYCRHACPTGKILGYIRRDSQRYRLSMIDAAVLGATCWLWLSPHWR